MISKKLCVIAMLKINAQSESGLKYVRRSGERERINAERRLTCIPGIIPVMLPKRTPKRVASKSSINIYLLPFLF